MKKQIGNDYYNKISDHFSEDTYDTLLYSYNDAMFNYSDHYLPNKKSVKKGIKKYLGEIVSYIFYLKKCITKTNKQVIISNAYVDLGFIEMDILVPPWIYSTKRNIFSSCKMISIVHKIKKEIDKKSIKVLVSEKFKFLIEDYELELTRMFAKFGVNALIVPNDLSFFENLSIKAARKSEVPSFVYLHGMPARYNCIDDNRADYLIVWGNGIKKIYIENGVVEEKIITLKHPVYSDFNNLDLESNLINVLVLSKAVSWTPFISTQMTYSDRSISFSYLEYLKEILKGLGLKKASLRLHPSEDSDFYLRNMSDDFFVIDKLSKTEALSKATLVIGPTSTMVLDAVKSGKNYILFDPVTDGLTLEGIELVEPFDGNSFIQLSNSFDKIKYNIENPFENINFEKLNSFFAVEKSDKERFSNIINHNRDS